MNLEGIKSYLVAAGMLLFVAFDYYFQHKLAIEADIGIVVFALGLVGITLDRGNQTQKLLAAQNVDLTGKPNTVAEVKKQAVTNAISKTLPALLMVMLLGSMLVGVTACGSTGLFSKDDTPAQTVMAAKQSFLVGLAAANSYGELPTCPAPAGAVACKNLNTLHTLQTSAHSAKAALDGAEATVTDPAFASTDAAVKAAVAAQQATAALLAITAILQAAK